MLLRDGTVPDRLLVTGEFLTLSEFAQRLHISRERAATWARQGMILAHVPGLGSGAPRHWIRIPPAEVQVAARVLKYVERMGMGYAPKALFEQARRGCLPRLI